MSSPRAATSVATSRSTFCAAEQAHHPVALLLQHSAVQRLAAVAVRAQRLDELVDLQPRAAEHERRRRALDLEHAAERERLVRARDDVGDLPHPRHLAGGRLLPRDRDPRRVLQVAAGDRRDARRHRGREERRLLLGGCCLQDRLEVLGEAHVEHLVGLVEHEERDRVELQHPALHVVERAARGRHDDVRATLERADLRVHRRAAVHRDDREPEPPRVLVDRLGDLHRQLARGHEHQPARAAAALRVLGGSAAASAARTPPSCRCPSPPARARPCPRAAAGSPRAGSASPPRSRARPSRPRAPPTAQAQRSPVSSRRLRGWPWGDGSSPHGAVPRWDHSSLHRAARAQAKVAVDGRGDRWAGERAHRLTHPIHCQSRNAR